MPDHPEFSFCAQEQLYAKTGSTGGVHCPDWRVLFSPEFRICNVRASRLLQRNIGLAREVVLTAVRSSGDSIQMEDLARSASVGLSKCSYGKTLVPIRRQRSAVRFLGGVIVDEHLVDPEAEQPGEAKGQRETGIELPRLDRVDRLARHACPLGEIRLGPAAFLSEGFQ